MSQLVEFRYLALSLDMSEKSLLFYPIFMGPLLILGAAILFQYFQNKETFVGGKISTPKSLWLSYTVVTWFFVPLFFIKCILSNELTTLLTFHLISMWGRGLLELVMIYKLYNWSPRYGIAHSLGHAVIVGALLLFTPYPQLLIEKIVFIYFFFVILTLACEVTFAVLFYGIRPKEETKIYFASNAPQWQKVNQMTKWAVLLGLSGYAISAGLYFS